MNDKDNFVPVRNHPNYLVNPNGDVFNLKRQRFESKYQSKSQITVNIDGKRKGLHRIVASAFIPNLNNKPFVIHKDKDRANNHVSNLIWATQSESTVHYQGKTYRLINPKGNLVVTKDIVSLAKSNELDPDNLRKVANGKVKSCYGWTNAENNETRLG